MRIWEFNKKRNIIQFLGRAYFSTMFFSRIFPLQKHVSHRKDQKKIPTLPKKNFSRFPKHTIFLFGPRDQLLLKTLDVLSLWRLHFSPQMKHYDFQSKFSKVDLVLKRCSCVFLGIHCWVIIGPSGPEKQKYIWNPLQKNREFEMTLMFYSQWSCLREIKLWYLWISLSLSYQTRITTWLSYMSSVHSFALFFWSKQKSSLIL